eukprot:TRINITY_DN2674_c0_g1_i1.p1 TRINITY_DN2674_c0_g1~~TRINITY_DN2674_c0_g1_i1.p1  ORF type:complete len:119 (+),score=8.07 TRINITY_DN2674_c0_g1_i1:48-404(+)
MRKTLSSLPRGFTLQLWNPGATLSFSTSRFMNSAKPPTPPPSSKASTHDEEVSLQIAAIMKKYKKGRDLTEEEILNQKKEINQVVIEARKKGISKNSKDSSQYIDVGYKRPPPRISNR